MFIYYANFKEHFGVPCALKPNTDIKFKAT